MTEEELTKPCPLCGAVGISNGYYATCLNITCFMTKVRIEAWDQLSDQRALSIAVEQIGETFGPFEVEGVDNPLSLKDALIVLAKREWFTLELSRKETGDEAA